MPTEWAMHDEASQRRRRTENLYSINLHGPYKQVNAEMYVYSP